MWKPLPPTALPTLTLLLSARAPSNERASAKMRAAVQAASERKIRIGHSLGAVSSQDGRAL